MEMDRRWSFLRGKEGRERGGRREKYSERERERFYKKIGGIRWPLLYIVQRSKYILGNNI